MSRDKYLLRLLFNFCWSSLSQQFFLWSPKLFHVPLFPTTFFLCSLVPENPWEIFINNHILFFSKPTGGPHTWLHFVVLNFVLVNTRIRHVCCFSLLVQATIKMTSIALFLLMATISTACKWTFYLIHSRNSVAITNSVKLKNYLPFAKYNWAFIYHHVRSSNYFKLTYHYQPKQVP